MDVSVLLENKLRAEWSASEFVPYMTAERLDFAAKEFNTLEPNTRTRVLLALLMLPVSQLKECWQSIQSLLAAAKADSEEWVRVVLDLVRARLPSAKDIGVDPAPEPSESFFEQEMKEIYARLGPSVNSDQEVVVSPDFAPLEWPHLCAHVLPEKVKIQDTNMHFTPRQEPRVVVRLPVPPRQQQQGPAQQPGGVPASRASTAEKVQMAVSAVDPSKFQRQQATKRLDQAQPSVPESIQKILADPSNDKLNDQGRALVYQFYGTEGRPTTGVQLVLLSETVQNLDDSTLLVTQTNLKLNYGDNTAKRVRTKKKLRVRATDAPAPSSSG